MTLVSHFKCDEGSGAILLNAVVDVLAPTLTFVMTNDTTSTITISSVTVPTGFAVVSYPTTIAPSTSENLVVKLLTTTPGTYSGDITVNSNAIPAAYNWAVVGTVS
jgi:hypothetical protein